jgi:hypothetical protein
MTSNGRSPGEQNALPFAANWHQRRVTAQFQEDPLRNLAMSNHALTDCYTLLANRHLLDLESLLEGLQAKTRADLIVYRHVGASLSKRATTPEEQQFVRAFYDGPLQVLSSFSLALEVCLLLLSREKLVQLENELHHLQETMQKNIAACYHWAQAAGGSD